MNLDQRRGDAIATHLRVPRPSTWTIARYAVQRRVPLPGVSYYEGQSHVAEGPVSDHVPRSIVLWYGFGAIVVWQDKLSFPGSVARMRSLAETGY